MSAHSLVRPPHQTTKLEPRPQFDQIGQNGDLGLFNNVSTCVLDHQ